MWQWLFFWKKSEEMQKIEEFAVQLGSNFFGAVSPQALGDYFLPDKLDKKSRKRIEREIQALALRISQFKALHQIGVYGKARLHQVFMERLEELDYDPKAVRELNQLLMVKSP